MAYEWLGGYCTEKPGAAEDWKEEWGAFRYLVGGKMFLMDGENKEGTPIVTLRLEPLRGDEMRKKYPGVVVPGYYMNKLHWNSVAKDGTVPDDELKSMIDESYRIILSGLTKKQQAEIGEE